MKTTVHIHVGMHKTGTTSIQATLFRNRRTLLREDVNYLAVSENHSTTLFPLLTAHPHRYRPNVRAGFDTEEKAARRNAAIDKAFRRELTRNRASHFVISGEDLFALGPAALKKLKLVLEPYADEIRIIVYVREPYSSINSAFQQRVRNGLDWNEVMAKPPIPRYRRISNFFEVFGREQVDVRIFKPERLKDGDLLTDFFDAIGVNAGVLKKLDRVSANRSLSFEAMLILQALIRIRPEHSAANAYPHRAQAIEDLLARIKGRPFQAPLSVFRQVQDEVQQELDWLHQILGEEVFSFDYRNYHDLSPEWSQDAIDSVTILICDMAEERAFSLGGLKRWGEDAIAIAARMLRRQRFGKPKL
jgi:hypothetical protein